MPAKDSQKSAVAKTNKATKSSKKMDIALAALKKLANMPDNVLNNARSEDREIAKQALIEIDKV